MTPREMQSAFEYELNKYDEVGIIKSDVIFYWLNTAAIQYAETIYSNNNQSVEETQKVTDILKNLIKEVDISTASYTFRPNSYQATLPTDYLHALNEEVEIVPTNGESKRVHITKVTSDTLDMELNNPYSPHFLHYDSAKPLRLFNKDVVILISDGNYTIPTYYLRYLKYPKEISLTDHDVEYTDFPANVHEDIVKLASVLLRESVGVPPNPQQTNENK